MGKSASKPKNREKVKNRDSNINWSSRFGSLPLRFKSRIHRASQSPKHIDIGQWLKSLDLEQYAGLFEKYTGVEDLLELSEADLKDLGVKISSHRASIISNLTILRAKYHGNFKRQPSIRHSVAVEKSVISEEDDKMSQLSTVYEPVQSKSLDDLIMEPIADPTMNAQDLRKALEWELSLENKDLRSHAWYHGAIPRSRAEDIVRIDGAFLVRDCTSQPGNYVLTCRTKTQPLHFVINKIILQPETVYEHIQYQFEGEAFDTVPDLITFYVGSGRPITQASGARIQNPVNRLYPLSFYASKYPPPLACRRGRIMAKQRSHSLTPAEVTRMAEKCNSADGVIQSPLMTRSAGCDNANRFNTHSLPRSPHVKMSLSTNTLGRGCKPTNGGDYWRQNELSAESPPPKPSRVPSAYHASGSDSGNGSGDSAGDSLDPKIAGVIIKNPRYVPASESSTTLKNFQIDWGEVETRLLEMHQLTQPQSIYDLENFQTILLPVGESKPLDGQALRGVKMILKESGPRVLANHITRTDLDVVFQGRPELKASGVELSVLPHGKQLRLDLIERTECLKLFVAVTILTCADEVERTETLNKWIEVAIDTKTALGNLFGFCGIMLGLCLPQVERLDSMWHMLRQKHTDSAFNFEAKLRPTLKNMNNCSNPQAPNTTIPHLLPLVLLLERTLEDFLSPLDNPNLMGLWESNTQDFGLTTMLNHLQTARKYVQSSTSYKRNSEIVLGEARMDELTVDMFRTEFHMKFLWGSRGAHVPHAERHSKFEQVLNAIADKYCAPRDDAEV